MGAHLLLLLAFAFDVIQCLAGTFNVSSSCVKAVS